MATERKKMKRKSVLKDELEKPTKEEYAVARCLKFDAPNREGKFQGNSANYFMGSKIVEFLLESKWSSKNKTNTLFTTRMSCVHYCARLLEKGFFHRVEKADRREKGKRDKKDAKETTPASAPKKRVKDETDPKDTPKEAFKDDNTEEKKKKRKTAKLKLHGVQQFIDGPDLYVWIYDPVPLKTFIIGLLLVIGVIAVCLFPLWPPEIKVGIYYLSCAAIGFISFIFALCIVRLVVFVVVWVGSLGKMSLWLLPNLTEDVGFFDSFKPLYHYKNKKEVVATDGGGGESEKDGGGGGEKDEALKGEGDVKDKDWKEWDDDGEVRVVDEDDEDDKNTNSSNGYEMVNREDYELEAGENEDEDGDDDDDDGGDGEDVEEEDDDNNGYDDDDEKQGDGMKKIN